MKKVKAMTFIKSLIVALSTYSIIPVPSFEWNEKNMKYAICFFPVVGVICGALVFLLEKFGAVLGVSRFFASAIAVCIPLLVTGGIHMDGFMDTVDALSSHAPSERKLEILSDAHIGAFAVIYLAVYLIINTALIYEIYSMGALSALCPVYVLSRSFSALCAVNMPSARKNGMLSSYTKSAKKTVVNITMALTALVSCMAMLLVSALAGAFAIGMGVLWIFIYCALVKKEFGGVTGDTAGFFLQLFELFCTLGIWIGAMI